MHEIILSGCTPVPLAAYLKALGIFRLVAEQADTDVRGYWRNETFILWTSLTGEDLTRFFLNEYRPSPVISPWNGRAGFLEGDKEEGSTRSGAELVQSYRAVKAPRFESLKLAANLLSDLPTLNDLNTLRGQRKKLEYLKKAGKLSENGLSELAAVKRKEGTLKRALIAELRGTVPEQFVEWMDACWRIGASDDTAPPAPLLGSGGNDGSRDLGLNFGHQLGTLFALDDPNGAAKPLARSTVISAAFGAPAVHLKRGTIGQFAPAQAGPNAGVGFDAEAPLNPWDTILSIEGAIVFGGAATRRLGRAGGESAFPFTVSATGTAGGGSALSDEARGEIWVPLWERPATFPEMAALFSEGRATLHRRSARDGLDFARAVVTLGVNRGISSFQRYGLLKREGKNYIATPLVRVHVLYSPRADFINDLDAGAWLPRFRKYSRSKDAPSRLQSIGRRLDEAIFAMTQDATPQAAQRVLIAVGEAAAYLASSAGARDPKKGNQRPPPRLSSAWFRIADDGTAEFCIAAALASLGRRAKGNGETEDDRDLSRDDGGNPDAPEAADDAEDGALDTPAANAVSPLRGSAPKIAQPPFRAHLGPLDETTWYRTNRRWGDRTSLTTWGAGPLDRNLAAVLERRLLFASRRNVLGGPFDARASANLGSVLAFLNETTNDVRIAALAQGLAWADPPSFLHAGQSTTYMIPLAYALLKPFFAPIEQLRELGALRNDASLPIPPGLVSRLNSGSVGAAVALASRRARASGVPVTFGHGAELAATLDGRRLLAALLIPIRTADLKRTLERAYPALFDDQEMPDTKEHQPNAA